MDIKTEENKVDLDYDLVKEEYAIQLPEVFEIKIKEETDDPYDNSLQLPSPPSHGKQQYTCEICGEIFTNKPNYKMHIYAHSREQFPCTLCHKLFPTSYAVKQHMQMHEIRRGRRKQKPYECEKCDATFNRKRNFIYHMRRCGKDFTCKDCGKVFKIEGCYIKHQLVHSTELVECLYCCWKFKSRLQLEYHMERNHKGFPIDLEDALTSGKIFNVDYKKFVKKEKEQ